MSTSQPVWSGGSGGSKPAGICLAACLRNSLMESARIFRGWQGAAARHSGDYGEEPQRGQPRKRPPTSHANFRDTTLAAATATAQQDVPTRRTDAITATRLSAIMQPGTAIYTNEKTIAQA